MPEYGRTIGGALSAVTKSGGNEFHGSIWGTWTPGGLAGAAGAESRRQHRRSSRHRRPRTTSVTSGRPLGGYIIKDKLWFFAGVQYAAPALLLHPVSFNTARPTRWATSPTRSDRTTPTPAALRRREVAQLHRQADLPRQPGPPAEPVGDRHADDGGGDGVLRAPGRRTAARTAASPRLAATRAARSTPGNLATNDSSTTWTSSASTTARFLDKRLLLDVRGGWHHQVDDGLPGDGCEHRRHRQRRHARRGRATVRTPTGVAGVEHHRPGPAAARPASTRPWHHRPRPRTLPRLRLLLRWPRLPRAARRSTATRAEASSPTW